MLDQVSSSFSKVIFLGLKVKLIAKVKRRPKEVFTWHSNWHPNKISS